jgi:hypothetical protein
MATVRRVLAFAVEPAATGARFGHAACKCAMLLV